MGNPLFYGLQTQISAAIPSGVRNFDFTATVITVKAFVLYGYTGNTDILMFRLTKLSWLIHMHTQCILDYWHDE